MHKQILVSRLIFAQRFNKQNHIADITLGTKRCAGITPSPPLERVGRVTTSNMEIREYGLFYNGTAAIGPRTRARRHTKNKSIGITC